MRRLLLRRPTVALLAGTVAAAQATAPPAPAQQPDLSPTPRHTSADRSSRSRSSSTGSRRRMRRSPTCSRRTSAGRWRWPTSASRSRHLYSLGRFQDVRVDALRPRAGRRQPALRPGPAAQRAGRGVHRHARPRQGTAAAHDRRSLRRTAADRARPLTRLARSRRSTADHGYLGAVVRCDAGSDRGGRREHRPDLSRRAGTARHDRRREDRRGLRVRTRHAFERQLGRCKARRALRSPAAAAAPRRVHDRSFASAASTRRRPARARRSPRTRRRSNLTIAVRSGPRRDRALRGRSAACRPAEGARAGRAGELRDRGSARGFDRRDPRVSPPAGVLERRRFMASRGDCRRVGPRLSDQEGHALLRRRAGPVERQPGDPGRRAADDDGAQAGDALPGIGAVRRVGRHHRALSSARLRERNGQVSRLSRPIRDVPTRV